MRELLWAIGILLFVAALGLIAALDPLRILALGQLLMVWSALLAMPFELLYFLGLYLALRRTKVPPGWYWRSFDHHAALGRTERWPILACFVVGSLCMVAASLGVLVVIAAVLSALR